MAEPQFIIQPYPYYYPHPSAFPYVPQYNVPPQINPAGLPHETLMQHQPIRNPETPSQRFLSPSTLKFPSPSASHNKNNFGQNSQRFGVNQHHQKSSFEAASKKILNALPQLTRRFEQLDSVKGSTNTEKITSMSNTILDFIQFSLGAQRDAGIDVIKAEEDSKAVETIRQRLPSILKSIAE